MEIYHNYSPNFDTKERIASSIKFIVFHYTGMQSERESIERLCDPISKVSCHYLINQNGKIFQLVKDKNIAWHAGKSCWRKNKKLNLSSIGIELVNKGHRFGYSNFKKKQILSLEKLCKKLIKKFKINNKNILGHSDIAPLRKIDPGEKFPWKELAQNKIGVWHSFRSNFLSNCRRIKVISKKDKTNFFKNLNEIGYCFSIKKKFALVKIVKAFQRRFRKELINGIIDKECLLIAENLSKAYKNS